MITLIFLKIYVHLKHLEIMCSLEPSFVHCLNHPSVPALPANLDPKQEMTVYVCMCVCSPDSRDVDPDPVGCAFIWVRGTGSSGYKIKEKSKV